jgi:hypothetical protein
VALPLAVKAADAASWSKSSGMAVVALRKCSFISASKSYNDPSHATPLRRSIFALISNLIKYIFRLEVKRLGRAPPDGFVAACIAESGIFVQEKIHDQFVEGLVKIAGQYKLGEPFEPDTTIGHHGNDSTSEVY